MTKNFELKRDITLHEVRVDVAKHIHRLELVYGFQEGDQHGNHPEDNTAFGSWLALRELVWRLDNPALLGKP